MPIRKKSIRQDASTGLIDEADKQELASYVDDMRPPTFGETVKASFETENSLGSFISMMTSVSNKPLPVNGYDPYDDDSTELEGYEIFAREFIASQSPGETQMIKDRIDKEFKNRQILQESGAVGFAAQMAAGITDPIYLPFMATGIAAWGTGAKSAIGTAGRVAAISAGSEALAEVAKQSTQVTRTVGESLVNIGGATILSGILGGTFKGLSRSGVKKVSKKIEQNIVDDLPEISFNDADVQGFGRSHVESAYELMALGPDAFHNPNLSDTVSDIISRQPELPNKMYDMKGALGIERWGVSPITRTLNSPEVGVKKLVSEMMENPMVTYGNIEGIPSVPSRGSVETNIKKWHWNLSEAFTSVDKAYVALRGGKLEGMLPSGEMSLSKFKSEVGKAMRRGDNSAFPEASKAAKDIRKTLFDPLKDRAVKLGLLDEGVDVKTATSYLSRIYKAKKIIAERPKWNAIVRRWLENERSASQAILPDKRVGHQIKNATMTDQDITRSIDSITNNILGTPTGQSPHIGPSYGAPLKGRVFTISDSAIEEFLESDIEMISSMYTRNMSSNVEMVEQFGGITLEKQIKDISRSWDDRIRQEKNPKRLTKLQNMKESDIADIMAMRDRILGTYKLPSDPRSFFTVAGRVVRDVNFFRMLGSMTISAIPDMARPIAVNGLKSYSKGILTLASSPQRYNMARKQAKQFAVGLDMVLNSRAMSMADVADHYSRGSMIERATGKVSHEFSKLTLMSQWNATMKQFSGVITSDRLLQSCLDSTSGKIKPAFKTRLAQSGIDAGMAKKIADQFQKHGDDGILKLSNAKNWDDIDAYDAFSSAVLKDVDRTIVTPKLGEKPLWTSSELGKTVFQFKTFAAAAHHNILLSDLQFRDAAAATGFMISVALGAMTYGLKNYIADREISKDPKKMIVESLDRSGAFGYFWDINNMVEKGTRGNFGVNALIGGQPMSRYASRNITGALFGPSLGTVQDLGELSGAVFSGEMTKRDLHTARKLLPGQNLFYIRQMLNKIENKMGRKLD